MVSLVIIGTLIIISLTSFLWWYIKSHELEVVYNNGPKYSKNDYHENITDGVKFIKIFVTEYKKVIDQEVHSKFKGDFQLLKNNSVGAKLVISSFGESLIYIYPSTKNQIIVDSIDFPVQPAFAYGAIDLNNPEKTIDLSKFELKLPFNDAINAYNDQPGSITIGEGYGGGFVFGGPGSVGYNGTTKLFKFPRQAIVGFAVTNSVIFDNSTPHYVAIYGRPGHHEFNLKGPLLLSSENTFDWTLEIARKLGKDMAEIEIKNLLTNSEFFRLSLADKKLRPKAEDIVQKRTRSEKDKSYQYPLWEFKKDVFELKEEAKKINIDSSYVDEILKETSLKPMDGTLFFYYPNARSFAWQWFLMNMCFLLILVVLAFTKYGDIQLLVLTTRAITVLGTNLSIITLITIANGWVFSKKPESLTIIYWILPCTIYLLCIALSLLLVNSTPGGQAMHKVVEKSEAKSNQRQDRP